jgi:hypothetical protein
MQTETAMRKIENCGLACFKKPRLNDYLVSDHSGASALFTHVEEHCLSG